MVSRYRDIIETNNSNGSVNNTPTLSNKKSLNDSNSLDESSIQNENEPSNRNKNGNNNGHNESNGNEDTNGNEENNNSTGGRPDSIDSSGLNAEFSEIALSDQQQNNVNTISSIQMSSINDAAAEADRESVQLQKLPDYPKNSQELDSILKKANVSITNKLEKALSNVAPFLRDIFIEFSQLLSKIVVGSHVQELCSHALMLTRMADIASEACRSIIY
jgi:cobalamin biosynthesis protein CobT